MRASLASPRLRRRLARLAVVVVAAVAAVVAGLAFDGGIEVEPTVRETGAAIVPETLEPARLTAADRKLALATAARFVETAVRRDHVADSYDLVSTSLRAGFTRREWATGEIPVVPYPVDGARWRVDYTAVDEVGIQVYVAPGPGSTLRPTVFLMALKASGAGERRRWLVDSWVPSASSAAPVAAGDALVPGAAVVEREGGSLSAIWLAAPVAILLLAAAIPIGLGVRGRLRARRAERDYRSSSSPS